MYLRPSHRFIGEPNRRYCDRWSSISSRPPADDGGRG